MAGIDLHERAAGVLLHLTSLPGPHGNGDLGLEAHRFANRLASAGQRWWQMLPVGPVGFGNSPYSAHSSFAGSPLLISLDLLARDGLLRPEELARPNALPKTHVDYAAVTAFRELYLRQAWAPAQRSHRASFSEFCEANARWLDDFALYSALKRAHGQTAWTQWDRELRDREPEALERARRRLADEIAYHRFEQWAFDRQWKHFKQHCEHMGIGLIGDVPIFVAHDSADVWAHRELFKLDEEGQPTVVTGVPPDYFSATGQRWGNPAYRWDVHRERGYDWWIDRLGIALDRFDAVRLDHFIGFERAWEIPAAEPTALRGEWIPGPGADLFHAVWKTLGKLSLIAEDLGVVTPDVTALRDQFDLPGIRILQFAFGDDPQAPDFLPHNYPRKCVVYTGTHDNDTALGWFNDEGERGPRSREQALKERLNALDYLGAEETEFQWEMIRMCLLSVADLAVIPMQDILGLGTKARMNHPGTIVGNWEWRFKLDALTDNTLERLAHLTRVYGRAPRR